MTKSSITELTSNNKKNKVVIHLSSSTKLGHYRASCLILFAFSCVSSDCFGELMEDLTVLSPKAIAMANAVTADPPGIDSIHFNPAGLMQFEGDTLELKLATFDLKNRYSTGPQQVDPTVKASYENLTQSPYPQDPYANQQGATSEPVLLIPGGSTETVPFPIVPLGAQRAASDGVRECGLLADDGGVQSSGRRSGALSGKRNGRFAYYLLLSLLWLSGR